jgi:glycosyltransferase involved in cell wall biosynthesis
VALPRVSIIIPVYNGSDYLRGAIESALGQTYPNVEVIVVNDGSNDAGATEAIARSFGDRIRYLWKENGHVASALNHGIRHMGGDCLSWLSHDDLYHPDKVAAEVEALAGQDRRTVVYSDFETLDVATGAVRPVRLPHVPPERFRYFITVNNSLHGCTLLVPRAAFDECGLFNERLRTTQDYDLWFRIAAAFRFVHLPRVLVTARLHPGQGSHQLRGVALEECDALLAGFVKALGTEEIERATGLPLDRSYGALAINMQTRGFPRARDTALERAREAARAHPSLRAAVDRAALAAKLRLASVVHSGAVVARLAPFGRATARRAGALLAEGNRLQRKFSRIYRKNVFGGRESRSGEGSSLGQTATIREAIPTLLEELGIKTMLDAPCGDFAWMRQVELPVEQYIGVDIVPKLIADDQRRYSNASRRFVCRNIVEEPLPHADLILCRDCLVHLNFNQAKRALRNFKASGAAYLLTTTFTARTKNVDLVGRDVWRTLNLELPPFNLPKPLRIIGENCTEGDGAYSDKSLGLWVLQDLALD